jgi:two-component system response regulator HydG
VQDVLASATAETLLGASEPMTRLREDIARVAASPFTTALIIGESGTGKELVARALHAGTKSDGRAPWIAVNCAALAPTLLESELFGYERGAFTGASPDGRAGVFEQAAKGSLFLDEIGELGVSLQAKLLRVIEDRSVRRLGGHADRKVELRLIAATNKDLAGEMQQNRFRQDLYYRLAVVTLRVPPLRERGADAWLLAHRFLELLRSKLGRRIVGFAPTAERAIRDYAWPGNVRELKNAVERACIACRGTQITADDLGLGEAAPRVTARVRPIAVVERELIEAALSEARGCVTTAARNLGIHRATLHRKLELLRIGAGAAAATQES